MQWQLPIPKILKEKNWKVVCILAAVGIALLLGADWFTPNTPKKNPTTTLTAEEYRQQIQAQLTELLQEMQGVGACQVYVSLENGVEYVYATNERNNADSKSDTTSEDNQKTVILIDGADGETGLLLTEIQPKIKGVVVVCEGGNQEAVVTRVTAAVTTALNISARRVCVTK